MLMTLVMLPLLAQAPVFESVGRIALTDALDGDDGRPRSIAVAPDGMIALGQVSPVSVVLLDSTGRMLRRIGRAGEGPGEFRMPAGLAFHHDTLIVADGGLRRVTLFNRLTGAVIRQFMVPTVSELKVDASGRLNVLALNSTFLRGGAGVGFVRFRLDGTLIDTVAITAPAAPIPPPDPYWHVRPPDGGGHDVPIPYQPRLLYGIARRGGIIVGWSGAPRLDLSTRSGSSSVLWRGSATSRVIPADVRRAVIDSTLRDDARIAPAAVLRSVYLESDLPARYPYYSRLDVDGAGRLWLQQPDAPRGVAVFEVLTSEGLSLGRTSVPSSRLGRLRAWSATRLATITEDDEGSWLQLYRIK